MNKAILQIFTALLVLGLFCGAATAAPIADFTANITEGYLPLSVAFQNQSENATSWQWDFGDGNTSIDQNPTNTYTSAGKHQVSLTVTDANGTSNTKNDVYINVLPPESAAAFEANVTEGIIPLTVAFTDKSTNTVSRQWSFGDGNSSQEQNATNTYTSAGKYQVSLTVTDANGTSNTKNDVYITALAPTESAAAFETSVTEGIIPLTVTFNDKSTDAKSWEWNFGEGSSNSTEQNPTYTYTSAGTYKVTLTITDTSGNQRTSSKDIKVSSANSGYRIWEEGMPETYTWTAQSYSGFYYDLDSGVSSENMTIKDIKDRSIDSGNIEYVTKPTETDFEYGNWGSYQIIGFMAEKYFAGYTTDGSKVIGDDVSPISNGVLSKILIDSDDKNSAYSGDSFTLEEGYSLNIVEVDVNGESVWVQLEKDGDVVDEAFVTSGDNYAYETDLGEAEEVPIIIVHFGTVFAGAETSAVFVQGLFQISDNYVELENGDTFGEMEVTSLSSSEIKMKNDDNVGLDQGETIDLMGKIQIQVADDSKLRFAPVLDTSEAGIYELRGTVYDEKINNKPPSWTPFNFEGFYYNIDEGIGTENLTVEEFGNGDIPPGKLLYKSEPQAVDFEHKEWGNFTVVGFMAEKYFAGYTDGSVKGAVDDVSLLSDSILCKVLTDSDDKESMNSGSALTLEEGYSLNINEVDVNGESVWVQLEKDGDVVDEAFVTSGDNYVYETDLGEATDVPLIIIHFGTVFSGTETSAVFVQGVFQLSDDYTEINNGDTFGEMEVSSVSESGIIMKNDDDIGLGQDETIEIMGNVSFKTADDSTLRFYPFVEVETGGEGNSSNSLKITVPDEVYANDKFNIEVTAGGEAVEGATVSVNESSVGETKDDGIVEYTAEEVGPLKITAEKDDYKTANKNINVIPPREKMTFSISPETVYVGDTLKIEIVEAIGGDPIEDANISINGNVVNKTGSDGKAVYTTDRSGTLKLEITKEGFLNQEANVKVRDFEAIFEFSNLVVEPLEVSAGKDATISVDVGNTGNAAGNKSVELLVNGNVTDSKEISLDIGKNDTVTFEHVEEVPGTYRVEVGGETATYTVKEKSSLLLYALGAIVLLIVGGAAYFFTKGGGDIGMVQEKIRELTRK
ncbi:S-layer protein domain-containing protein [Methanosarcina sp.]|uniref:S-layer protein domain-containing protein n=1 Tax=Methanosarcina sp. TaxID=2213 RepID=UPI003C72F906